MDDAHDVIGVAMHREDEDFDLGQLFAEQFRDGQSVHFGHIDIHEDDIGGQFACFAHGFLAIGRFADDREVFVAGEGGADAFSHDGMIVDQEEFDAFFHFIFTRRLGGLAVFQSSLDVSGQTGGC